MSDLHTWSGLLVGWLLYAMFLTGTVSYFKEELSDWMRPEVVRQAQTDAAEVAQRVADHLGQVAAGTTQWSLTLPTVRSNTASAFWRMPQAAPGGRRTFGSANFNPATGEEIKARDTLGGEFFYRFHFQFYYMPVLWGRWLAGFCAMFMLVAIVSGVITHKKIFVDFFTFRWGKGQRSWLDAHNALSVFGLPFHAMITYTGLVTLMALYMPWGDQAAYKSPAQRQELTTQVNAFLQPGKATGVAAPLAPVDEMVRQAQARWGKDQVGRVTVANPGDSSARVALTPADGARVSMSPQYLLFDGVSGKLIEVHDQVGPAAETRGVMYALHLGRFSDLQLRWLYFIVSLAGTAMVGTGLVMWTVKRRQQLPDPMKPYFGFRLVERLNIAAIAGLSVAMTAYLWGNRLLPVDLGGRGAAEVNVFFGVWAGTLLYALARPARRAWIELLWLAAAMLALLPVLNALTTSRPFWRSVAVGDWVYAGVDLMAWALALLHVMLALTAQHHKPRVKPARKAGPRAGDRVGQDAGTGTGAARPAAVTREGA
ncbi:MULTISPECIES: PepSY domain-containing protein [unclassified Achromobacter]|uniref:PepSY-associated TM helix domain-containing protein n=1 Tax=unclassified Achromobacter TaxID=2626865 RepID=UPI000B5160C9|nr:MULTISPECIES: PepSY-associated TM helix domain-containing protein [unclassified Achromobacter]OWT73841.1 peptidase [Achromobacter sp. HZ34]OWT79828.1 peptidase [Achromobacter sp. HZ28]